MANTIGHFNIGKGSPRLGDNQFLYNPFKEIIALEDLEGGLFS